jgi:hypothetical protein
VNVAVPEEGAEASSVAARIPGPVFCEPNKGPPDAGLNVTLAVPSSEVTASGLNQE